MSVSNPTWRPCAEYDCEINFNYDVSNVNYVLNINRNLPVFGDNKNQKAMSHSNAHSNVMIANRKY